MADDALMRELIVAVADMRRLQSWARCDKSALTLDSARRAERRVDALLARVIGETSTGQRTLGI